MSDIECPYCGKEDAISDAWELGDGEHEVECEGCEKEFIATGETVLNFSSSKKSCGESKHDFGEWRRIDYDDEFYARASDRFKSLCGTELESLWTRECVNCDKRESSGFLPLHSPLPDHLKESE